MASPMLSDRSFIDLYSFRNGGIIPGVVDLQSDFKFSTACLNGAENWTSFFKDCYFPTENTCLSATTFGTYRPSRLQLDQMPVASRMLWSSERYLTPQPNPGTFGKILSIDCHNDQTRYYLAEKDAQSE